MREIVKDFSTEARALHGKITLDLLAVEDGEHDARMAAAYERVARGLHTLKGTAATLGLQDESNLVHRVEDVVLEGRDGQRALGTDLLGVVLEALDQFTARVDAHAADEVLVALDDVLARLVGSEASEPSPPAASAAPTDEQPLAVAPLEEATQEASAAEREPASGQSLEQEWRVDASKVRSFSADVERLRQVRLRLVERHREIVSVQQQLHASSGTLSAAGQALRRDAEDIAAIVEGLEDTLTALATLPLRTIVEPMHRSVRDLARNTGKRARLRIVGDELRIDRVVLDALRGPLVHLIRNAVDHGIEAPEVRDGRGKDGEGLIVLRAELQGNALFVEVADDGEGLRLDKIRRRAVELGLLGRDDDMSPNQLQQFIFKPGFSTAESITSTSGRGVGLDVVQDEVGALKGVIEVQSTAGKGTRFLLTLPVALGGTSVLIARLGEHRLGIPTTSVESVVRARRSELTIGRNRMRMEYQDEALTVVDLGDLMGLRQPLVPKDGHHILVIAARGERTALVVDEVIADADLVIHPLPDGLDPHQAYQGAATLADGQHLLVLRPRFMVQSSTRRQTAVSGTRQVLVVDDSISARALHRTVLEAGGFSVHTASGGLAALQQLDVTAYDAVISDIHMDDLDGLTLTARIRDKKETRHLPVILVTGNVDDDVRLAATNVRADALLSKSECAAGNLLAAVQKAISRKASSDG